MSFPFFRKWKEQFIQCDFPQTERTVQFSRDVFRKAPPCSRVICTVNRRCHGKTSLCQKWDKKTFMFKLSFRLQDPACSPAAIDAGNALLLLTKASKKVQRIGSLNDQNEVTFHKEASTSKVNSESSVPSELTQLTVEESCPSEQNAQDEGQSCFGANWKVVVVPEKEGVTKVGSAPRFLGNTRGKVTIERRSSRLASKRVNQTATSESNVLQSSELASTDAVSPRRGRRKIKTDDEDQEPVEKTSRLSEVSKNLCCLQKGLINLPKFLGGQGKIRFHPLASKCFNFI